jgi:hypothetical protein
LYRKIAQFRLTPFPIFWDRHSGLICPNHKRQTPALGLGHELAHAAGDGKKARHLVQISDSEFENKEERRVITSYEIPAAKQFGEGVRWGHGGDSATPFFTAPGPTSLQGPPHQ